MGGHTIAPAGWLIDMKCMVAMSYEKESDTVVCGPGCLWSDLIVFLNRHGKSPRTMQSYCTFSVGGSLAVNAHGITTDYCFAESVVQFRMAHIGSSGSGDATTIVTSVCRPGDPLFRLALGGYGLFGVITEVQLKVVDNMGLELDTLNVKVENDEFVHYYKSIRTRNAHTNLEEGKEEEKDETEEEDEDDVPLSQVAIKLARLNILDCSTVQLFVYRRANAGATISGSLALHPTEMNMKTRLLYKWMMPVMREARFAFEASSGQAIDMPDIAGLTRNEALFESAVPLAKLYDPLFHNDDTFVLHEFFVPMERFGEWIENAKPIYKELADSSSKPTGTHQIILLNTTIRYVECDNLTFLSYARAPSGSFAFVLYYRLPRTPVAEEALGQLHNRFAAVTLELGGTFYLPYRKCYSQAMLEQAYPMIREFAALKAKHDPVGMFSNLWFDHYVRGYIIESDPNYGTAFAALGQKNALVEMPPLAAPVMTDSTALPRSGHKDLVARSTSYRRLLGNHDLRKQFKEQFLVNIFSFADPLEVMQAMTKHAWDPRNKDDIAIYKQIRAHFHGPEIETVTESNVAHWSEVDTWGGDDEDSEGAAAAPLETSSGGSGAYSKFMQMVRSIKQLHTQKIEIARETVAILSRLGKGRKGGENMQHYVSFGDNGKLVTKLRHVLDMRGNTWVCNDSDCGPDNIAGILERGRLDPVGVYVPFDYMEGLAQPTVREVCAAAEQETDKSAWLAGVRRMIPDNSADLVTINQGLHHIPPARLLPFLREVLRILRPGGVFIFREHDVNLDRHDSQKWGCPLEMVDMAHSIFNAVTGASTADERREVRAFRPLSEWREIVRSVGLVDAFMQGLEDGDCTCDEMLAFYKGPLLSSSPPSSAATAATAGEVPVSVKDGTVEEEYPDAPPVVEVIRVLMGQMPSAASSTGTAVFKALASGLAGLAPTLRDLLLTQLPEALGESMPNADEMAAKVEPSVSKFLQMAIDTVSSLQVMLERAEINTQMNVQILYPEFFLILPVIDRKVRERPDAASDLEKRLIAAIRDYVPALLISSTGAVVPEGEDYYDDRDGSEGSSASERENSVSGRELLEVFRTMEQSIPNLMAPSTLAKSGFSLKQQSALAGKFGGRDALATAMTLASYLDKPTWIQLRAELLATAKTGDLPTKERLISASPAEHAWRRCLKAFLRSPIVKLTAPAKFALKMVDLKELVELHDNVKKVIEEEEKAARLSTAAGEDVIRAEKPVLDPYDLEKVRNGLSAFSSTGAISTVRIAVSSSTEDHEEYTIPHVSKILRATYGYKSLTSRPSDITIALRDHHEQRGGSTLLVTKETLEAFRNHTKGRQAMDDIRAGAIKVITFGQAGTPYLKVVYRNASGEGSSSLVGTEGSAVDTTQISDMVRIALRNSGVTRDLHTTSGAEYTWFKLCEWMQVDIMDLMVKSLDHTPWYRFPFMKIMKIYFKVLLAECSFVSKKHGFATAYASMAFVTDLIPGIVMSFIFSQLQALALPLIAMTPEGGLDDLRKSEGLFLEEIVLFVRLEGKNVHQLGSYFQKSVDSNISEVKVVDSGSEQQDGDGLIVVVAVPPFKAFSDALLNIATVIPSAQVLEISNQSEVQVRVSCREEDEAGARQWLSSAFSQAEVDVITRYQFPIGLHSASERSRVQLALKVGVTRLMTLFRGAPEAALTVEQTYEWYN
jgi:SAM-dependent methyltransferase